MLSRNKANRMTLRLYSVNNKVPTANGGALPSLAGSERGHVSLRERHRGFECLELLGSWHRPRRASCRARDDPGQVGGRVLGRPRASLEATLMSAEPL